MADDGVRTRAETQGGAFDASGLDDVFADEMRVKADAYACLGLFSTSRFLADKAWAVSSNAGDVLRLARAHADARQPRRTLRTLSSCPALAKSLPAQLLASQCSLEIGELDECLGFLGETEDGLPVASPTTSSAAGREPSSRRRGQSAISSGDPPSRKEHGSSAKASAESGHSAIGVDSDTPEIRAAMCVVRGRVFQAMEDGKRAAWWYKRALVWDVYCYEALTCLMEFGLMSPKDAIVFTDELVAGRGANSALWNTSAPTEKTATQPMRSSRRINLMSETSKDQSASHSSVAVTRPQRRRTDKVDSRAWVSAFYRLRVDQDGPLPIAPNASDVAVTSVMSARTPLAVGDTPQGSAAAPDDLSGGDEASKAAKTVLCNGGMQDNIDILAVRAARLFDSFNFEECLRLTRIVLERDPFFEDRLILIHLASLVELDERQDLFEIGHALADNSPREARSWMAVGYYYIACKKFEIARRYLQKATSINPRLGPAWLAYGHAFAAQDESDQAMAAYRTASRLYPGARLPDLYIGMEYARQNSLRHAMSFFQSARDACMSDPAPHHELGVVAFKSGDVTGAVKCFNNALSRWEASDKLRDFPPPGGRRAEAEEATLFNLGHCYRRLREFKRARDCYERALRLRPRSASTCGALGMALHALGDYSGAVSIYHRALGYNPEDSIVLQLLDRALTDMCTFDTIP